MKSARKYAVVLVTAPDLKSARRLARAALEARLAACVNIVRGIESHYWWQDRIERGSEVLLMIKSAAARLVALEKCILDHHPYDTPEFLVLPVQAGSRKYLDWIAQSVR